MTDLAGTLLGQYQLTEVIGRGGMATVYKAYQRALDREVAVKVLLHTHDPTFAERFKREALASARLQHPYILPVYDFGEQENLLYLVLQYVEGGATLAGCLNDPIEPIAALRLIGHVLEALGYAHERGIIHRDIKPANILMRSPRWPLLADFGIAKLINETGPLTQGGLLLGTATYMAPEQALGRPAGVLTDLYALGVVLYELLTGKVPFYSPDPVVLLHQHAYQPLPPPRSLNPRISVGVEQFLIRALAKDPAVRYQSAADMAAELGRLAEQLERSLSDDQLRSLYEAGAHAFEAERWGAAIEPLDQVVAREPAFGDALELLELARAAQARARAGGRLFRRSAVAGAAVKLLQQGEQKERSGDLTGALAYYHAARAAATGRARDEIAARMAVLLARTRRQRQRPVPSQHSRARPALPASQTAAIARARIEPAKIDRAPSSAAELRLPSMPVQAAAATSAARTPVLFDDHVRPARARLWRPLAALALCLALLGGGGGIIWANQRRAPAAGRIAIGDTATSTASAPPTATATASPAPPTATATASPSPTATDTPTQSPTLTPTPTAINSPTPLAPEAITNDRLNLRAGPGQEYATLATYDAGTLLKLLGKNSAETWLQVQAANGQVGWMTALLLQVNVPLSDIPIVAAPPPTARPTARPRQAPQPQPTPPPAPPADTQPPAPVATDTPPTPTEPPEPTARPKPKEPQPTAQPRPEPTSPPRREPTSPPRP